MLPGPQPPLLMGYPAVPSASPSAAPSSSVGASIAIIAIVIIASTMLICCIKVLCRSSRPPSSISRRASSLGESDRKRAAEAAAVHASLGASASSKKHAEGLVFGLKVPVPSAPSLPEVELVILGLLAQPPVLLQQGMFCCEDVEAVGGSRGWLHSYLATLWSTWSGRSESHSTTMVSSVSSGCATRSLSLVPSSCGSTDLCSRSWDHEAAVQKT
ncbi:hypothetical protein VPH35_108264 [Triticum aestivum]